MSLLKFIGNGCAFNPKAGCNSAYFKKEDTLFLFDCGGDVFSRIIKLNLLENVKKMIVLITHTHSDHIGSLSDLIFYCHYILNIVPNVYGIDENIVTLLNINGVHDDYYEFLMMNPDTAYFDSMGNKIKPIATNHYEKMKCCGYLLNIDNNTIYYSGDSNMIPTEVINKLLKDEIQELYQDTCGMDFNENPHLYIEKLKNLIPKEYRSKVYCMHLDEILMNHKNIIISNGFNLTKNEFDILNEVKKIAIYAGSFDPLTNGHKQVIEKASKMFDKVIVGVLINENKKPMFNLHERVDLSKKALMEFKNVEVKSFDGLLVDFAKKNNAQTIIRGLRNVTDYEQEIQMAMINKKLNPDIETIFILPNMESQYISSSIVKTLYNLNSDISWLVPKEILNDIYNKFKE